MLLNAVHFTTFQIMQSANIMSQEERRRRKRKEKEEKRQARGRKHNTKAWRIKKKQEEYLFYIYFLYQKDTRRNKTK